MSRNTIPQISRQAEEALQKAGLDSIITDPMQSAVIRYALGAGVAFFASKVFKLEMSEAQVQDAVEFVLIAVALGMIAYHRWRSTRRAMPVEEAAELFKQHLSGVADRVARRDILTVLEQKHPKVFAMVKDAAAAIDADMEQQAHVIDVTHRLLSLQDPAQVQQRLAALKAVDEETFQRVVARMGEIKQNADSGQVDPP